MNVYEVPAPDAAGARRIAQRLYREIRESHAWGARFPELLEDPVLDRLSSVAPREMRRALMGAFGNAKLAGRAEIVAADLPADRSARRQRIGF
jgi:ATP-dependent Lon protease